jgi:hypothetical protein
VVHLPKDIVHVLFFVNIDGTFDHVYIYMDIHFGILVMFTCVDVFVYDV